MEVWLSLTNTDNLVVSNLQELTPHYIPWHRFVDATLEDLSKDVAKLWARKLRILAKDLEEFNG